MELFHALTNFILRKRACKHCTHDWMRHRACLDRVTNSKISSSNAKQAQAIKYVTLLTEQCSYIAIYGSV